MSTTPSTPQRRPLAVVTGASRGIGAAIAKKLALQGYWVAINFASQAEAAEGVLAEIRAAGGEGGLLGFNVADSAAATAALQAIQAAQGPVAVLVNNAGITRDGLLVRAQEADWDALWNVNVKGALICSRAVMKTMMRERAGSIIQVASVVGLMGNAGQSAYSATKAGLLGLTKSLAQEVGSRGIRVNAVSPGFIETEMTHHLTPETRETYLRQIPLGAFGSPDDVAECVAFLASPAARYITGQVLGVCGGLYM